MDDSGDGLLGDGDGRWAVGQIFGVLLSQIPNGFRKVEISTVFLFVFGKVSRKSANQPPGSRFKLFDCGKLWKSKSHM